MNNLKVLTNGIFKENPTFALLLGMCPTLGAVSYTHLFLPIGNKRRFILYLFGQWLGNR